MENTVSRRLLALAAVLAGGLGLVGLVQTADLAVVLGGGTGLLMMTRIYPLLSFISALAMVVVLFALVQVLHRHYGVTSLTVFAALFAFFMLVTCTLYLSAEWVQHVRLREMQEWASAPLSFIAILFGLGLNLPQFRMPRPFRFYGLTMVFSHLVMNQYVFQFSISLAGPWLIALGGLAGNCGELVLAFGLWRERRIRIMPVDVPEHPGLATGEPPEG